MSQYRQIKIEGKARRKPKAVKGPKAVKAWCRLSKDETALCPEFGLSTDPEYPKTEKDFGIKVIPVLITPLRPAARKGKRSK